MSAETLPLPEYVTRGRFITTSADTSEIPDILEAPVPIDFGAYLHRVAAYQKSLPDWLHVKDKALVMVPGAENVLAPTVRGAVLVASEALSQRLGGSWQSIYVVRLVDYKLIRMLADELHAAGKLPVDRDLLPYGLYKEGREAQLLVPVSGNPTYGMAHTVDPAYAEDFIPYQIYPDELAFRIVKTNDYLASLRTIPPTVAVIAENDALAGEAAD